MADDHDQADEHKDPQKKEDFVPIDPENVRMYVCGPTVYDRAHIGNARPVIVFDVLYRLLRHVYGPDHVTYVRNFTDVDDKITPAPPKVAARLKTSLTRRHSGISMICGPWVRLTQTRCRARPITLRR